MRKLIGVISTSRKRSPLIGVISISGKQGPQRGPGPIGPQGPVGPAGGVNSFNKRQGNVMPMIGDYSSGMVGALDENANISNLEILALF